MVGGRVVGRRPVGDGSAQDLHAVPDALGRGDRDGGREDPRDERGVGGEQAEQDVHDDGFGALGQATDEPQRPSVIAARSLLL